MYKHAGTNNTREDLEDLSFLEINDLNEISSPSSLPHDSDYQRIDADVEYKERKITSAW